MQAPGECIILAGIDDKTRILLDRFSNQGTNIGNKGIIDTSTFENRLWNVALRVIDGINANGRWSLMQYRLKFLYRTKINISKACISYTGTIEVSIMEGSTTEIGTHEFGTAEFSTAEVRIVEGSTAEVSTAEINTIEVSIVEVGTVEVSIAEVRKYTWMLFPPQIPCLHTLFENVEM